MNKDKIQQSLEVDFKVLIKIQLLCLIHKVFIFHKINKFYLI